jgi:TonB family protein
MKLIREMETNLTRRIDLLEGQLESQARKMNETRQLAAAPDAADARFHQLLSAMEKFWAQAPRQMPLLAAPTPVEEVAAAPVPEPTPTPVLTPVSEPAPVIEPTSGIEPTSVSEPPPVIEPEPVAKSVSSPAPAAEEIVPVAAPPSAKKPKRWWPAGLAIAAAAVPITFAIPVIQHSWSGYTTVQSMPLVQPKPPAAPALPAIRNPDPEPKAEDSKPANRTIGKPPQRFDGPQIALDIPPNIRSRVPAEARVQVIVAIDNQGNVTRAEVASAKGRGARLLTKEALAAARKSRFRPAHEGDRPVESQMVLTYFVKQDSAEF